MTRRNFFGSLLAAPVVAVPLLAKQTALPPVFMAKELPMVMALKIERYDNLRSWQAEQIFKKVEQLRRDDWRRDGCTDY